MSKTIVIKITKGGTELGPFTISDIIGTIIAEGISMGALVQGITLIVADNLDAITLSSTGKCKFSVTKLLEPVTVDEFSHTPFVATYQGCSWRHLTDVVHYNFYYNNIEPYIIEHPFSYQYLDEILQNVIDYTKAFEYTADPGGVFTNCLRVQPNDKWFNEVVIYNDQQSTGLLKLEPKPLNNLQAYNSYPKYNTDSKIITYTKSDNFYQYNNFWNVVKNPLDFLFKPSCESLSIDKVINQANMNYSTRSFRKDTIRAKDVKIRHMLTNSSTIHLVSQFIIGPAMNSYK